MGVEALKGRATVLRGKRSGFEDRIMNAVVATVFDLSPSEKLQLVEDLWDDIAATPEEIPVHPWQIEELEKRVAEMDKNPSAWLTWDEVKKRVRSRYGR